MFNLHPIQETLLFDAERKAIVLEGDIIAVCALDLFPIFLLWILRRDRNLDSCQFNFGRNVQNLCDKLFADSEIVLLFLSREEGEIILEIQSEACLHGGILV